jgi:2-polyprenyl-3-methyl-5-hydroxy-6-metoxy-1,4-benzoquinol methylase
MKKWLPEELEEIACDFCGSREISREFIRADGMRVVECAICGLAFLNPRPRPEFIPEFYKEDYFTGASAERGEGGLNLNLDIASSEISEKKPTPRIIEIINKKFGGFKGKRVLEIGCATGDLLMQIKKEGADVKGLEISDFAANIARKRGLDVKTGTLEDYIKELHDYHDIVMAFEVIEHVLSPIMFLKNCAELIRPGGLLLLSTPNYKCSRRFGNEWLGFNTSFEHIYFFSLDVLTRMASKSGFVIKYVESSKSLGETRTLNFLNRQIERLNTLSFFIKEIGIHRTIKAVLARTSGYYPYALGHNLLAVFMKRN